MEYDEAEHEDKELTVGMCKGHRIRESSAQSCVRWFPKESSHFRFYKMNEETEDTRDKQRQSEPVQFFFGKVLTTQDFDKAVNNQDPLKLNNTNDCVVIKIRIQRKTQSDNTNPNRPKDL
ncbi:hypothetical protein D3C72_1544400 [compost metagenome]